MNLQRFSKRLSVALLFAAFSSAAVAQDNSNFYSLSNATTVTIPVERVQFDSVQRIYWVDLQKEIAAINPQIMNGSSQIQKLTFSVRSGIGGGSAHLQVNGNFVDGKSFETNPDSFDNQDAKDLAPVVLENLKLSDPVDPQLISARLILHGRLRLSPIIVTFGDPHVLAWKPIKTPTLLNDLPWLRGGQPGAAVVNEAPRKKSSSIFSFFSSSDDEEPAAKLTVQQAPAPRNWAAPAPAARTLDREVRNYPSDQQRVRPAQNNSCVQNLCINSRVSNPNMTSFKGTVKAVMPERQLIGVKWDVSEDVVWVSPSQVRAQ